MVGSVYVRKRCYPVPLLYRQRDPLQSSPPATDGQPQDWRLWSLRGPMGHWPEGGRAADRPLSASEAVSAVCSIVRGCGALVATRIAPNRS